MKVTSERPTSVECPARTMSGLPIMALNIATVTAVPFILIDGVRMGEWANVIGGMAVLVAMAVIWRGFLTLEPNEACVLLSWGDYKGTVRDSGFHWVSPFARKKPVTLKAQSLCVEKLKVHDKHGAPIELAAVIVWRIVETARATFDVHDAGTFVRDQCENAVRHLAAGIAEPMDKNPAVLRRGVGQLQEHLRGELQERVTRAGVTIDEVRLSQRCENWTVPRVSSVADV